ncbi:uncharacterized protein LY89DRAFT_752521 [Mollisia scopiformis]|uniref:Uncharacterized protein n=1 Tax=Mollisia scopiformis TaxID=149040 RepID=A0A194X2T7_MOLSC|nr:uncharacterized protein LY89DRAFT_752521 [Mollisia scopiformis]KUJ14496.1 hypothetical protein LY89DRAFT_752521 [Mollisia scopiformis]
MCHYNNAQAQTMTSTSTVYESTTTLQCISPSVAFSATTEPASAVVTITVTTGGPSPAANKMARQTMPGSPARELVHRDLVTDYTTITVPALTSIVSPCVTTILSTIPGQEITVTNFVPYVGPTPTKSASSSSTSSSTSVTPSRTPIPSIITPPPGTPTQSSAPSSIQTPTTSIQTFSKGSSFTTTLGTNPITILPLSGGSSALVNSATLSVGGSATSIGNIVLTYASSGLVAISTPSPISTSNSIVTTMGSSPLTIIELPGEAIVDGTTLSAGGPEATINGVEVTYASTGLIAVETGNTISLGGIIMSIFSYTELDFDAWRYSNSFGNGLYPSYKWDCTSGFEHTDCGTDESLAVYRNSIEEGDVLSISYLDADERYTSSSVDTLKTCVKLGVAYCEHLDR